MEIWLMIMVFILGLCLGSFVNMLVYRVAIRYGLKKAVFAKATTSRRRSFCDYCGRQLKWYENVPVFSWIIQKGKSRCCHKKLSVLYPIVELLIGILLLFIFKRFNLFFGEFSVEIEILRLFYLMIVVTLLVFLMVFDIKYLILPDFAVIILVVISFLGVVVDEINIVPYLLSSIGAAGFLAILNLVTKGKGMGWGDVKFALFMGLFLGWPKILVAMYIAFIVGAVVGLILMLLKKIKKKTPIAFGPFLILGVLVAWCWGDQIINLMRWSF